jgi:hypothetical protein
MRPAVMKFVGVFFGPLVLLAGCGGGGGGGGDDSGPDLTPAQFTFTDQANVASGTERTSTPVMITGIDAPAAVTVTGGTYSVGCTATYVGTAGTISANQTVCVRHMSSASAGTATNTTLTVGGVSDVFTSMTAGAVGAATSLLPFLAANGDVRLLDPTVATGAGNPATVDTGLAPPTAGVVCNDCFDRAETFYTGTVTGSTVSGLRAARLAYIKGGQVYKVNLTKGASNAPVQISSVDDACRIVRAETTDLADVDNTAVVIERSGDDSCGTAGDNVATVIRLNAAALDAGLDIPLALDAGNPLHARTNASGAITGYVSFEITDTDPLLVELVSRDASLGARSVLKTLESSLGLDLTGANLERADLTHLYVTATPANLGLTLFRVESGGGLSAALHSFAGYNDGNPIQDGVRDATSLYFSDESRLLKIALGATTESADVIATMSCATAEACLRIEHRALDTGRVVFEANDENITVAGGVFSAASDGSTPAATPLASNPEPSGLGGFAVLHSVAGGRAYVNIAYHDTPTNSVDALKVETDGDNPATTTSAYWAGSNRATTLDLGATSVATPASIFLATRVGQQPGDGTDTLFAVDPATGVTGAQLGIVDDASVFLSLNVNGLGRYALARVEKRRDDGTLDYDTYFVDAEAAASLAPLAATAAANDIPLDSLQRLTGNLCLVCL